MTSADEYCLRLSRIPLLAGSLIAAVFPATWILTIDNTVPEAQMLWTLFAFGFALPLSMFLLYLVWRRDPIILISGGTVELRHVTFPWKTTSLSISEVDRVEADWDPNEHERCSLKIHVRPSCFDRQRHCSRWLCGEEGVLTVLLNNTVDTPDKVAAAFNSLLKQTRQK